jgi:hypothetical protein
MTAVQRLGRHRARLREIAKDVRRRLDGCRKARVLAPPHGYDKAKAKLQAEGHEFERARREFRFEEGLFVDGAFVYAADVIALADLNAGERKRWLDDRRREFKDFAVNLVLAFMDRMRVSRDELFRDSHEISGVTKNVTKLGWSLGGGLNLADMHGLGQRPRADALGNASLDLIKVAISEPVETA